VVAKTREKLEVNKKRSNRFHTKMFNPQKLSKVNGKENYCAEVSNRFAALVELDAEVEINIAWQMTTENIKIVAKEKLGSCELKHKPWFNKECSELLYTGNKIKCSGYRIQAK
jgi:hypothetical protein